MKHSLKSRLITVGIILMMMLPTIGNGVLTFRLVRDTIPAISSPGGISGNFPREVTYRKYGKARVKEYTPLKAFLIRCGLVMGFNVVLLAVWIYLVRQIWRTGRIDLSGEE